MKRSITLPRLDGKLEAYEFEGHAPFPEVSRPPLGRRVYAAAHVVADPLGDPVGTAAIDWEGTLAFRRHLWKLGFGVADAMDTAQRGMGLDAEAVRTLIDLTIRDSKAEGGDVVCGITTDELVPDASHSLDDIVRSYLDQLEFVEERGGSVVMMASRALVTVAHGPEDYARVYEAVLSQASRPVILHWLGPMFDPALAGYWGSADAWEAMESLLTIVTALADRVDGVKVSMLDEELEVAFRRRLPDGVRCYTGDDFNYPTLIAGDEERHSDALLGIFDGIAPAAAAAFQALDAGDVESFHRILEPTVPLSRHIFQTPTYHYKTGLTFLAYINGHQSHFRMVGGQESSRSILHLAELVRLADRAGLLPDVDMVISRLTPVLQTAGIH